MKKSLKKIKKLVLSTLLFVFAVSQTTLFSLKSNHSFKCYVKIWHYENKKNVGILKNFSFFVSDKRIAINRAYFLANQYVLKKKLKYVQVLIYRIERNNKVI